MRRLLALALAGALALAAQKPEERQLEKKIIQLKYVNARQIAGVINTFAGEWQGRVNINPELNLITISAPAEVVAAVEGAIKRLDVPPKNIELTVYYLVASNTAGGNPVPAELQPVVNQIRTVFNFKHFALVDTLNGRTRSGNGLQASGIVREIPGFENRSGMSAVSHLGLRSATVAPDEKVPIVRIDGLSVGLRVPALVAGKWDYLHANVETQVDIRAGQKVVVGKSNVNSPDQALVLVLVANVVD